MKQYIRKADIILFIILVVTGLAASAALSLSHHDAGSGAKVVIESGGEHFATYPLGKDTTIIVPASDDLSYEPRGTSGEDECTEYMYFNIVRIESGEVSVTGASCRNQVCVKHSAISRTGESIVCLPNRLVVRIEDGSGEGESYDSVTS